MALLGELSLTKGKVGVEGRVAYVSQQPWVFSASVRQNITFGQAFDAVRYTRVVQAAALTKVGRKVYGYSFVSRTDRRARRGLLSN